MAANGLCVSQAGVIWATEAIGSTTDNPFSTVTTAAPDGTLQPLAGAQRRRVGWNALLGGLIALGFSKTAPQNPSGRYVIGILRSFHWSPKVC